MKPSVLAFVLVSLIDLFNCRTRKSNTSDPLKYILPSIFPEFIPPYINFPKLNSPQKIPKPIKKSLLWPTTWDILKPLFDRVALSTDLTLLSNRDSCFTHHGEETIIGTHKRLKCKLIGRTEKYMKIKGIHGLTEICFKDKLASVLNNLQASFPNHSFKYILPTFNIPEEFNKFKNAWVKTENKLWISKNPRGSMSRGVFIVSHWKDLPRNKFQTIQKYLHNPWLYQNRKIEFRVLILVTSLRPLRVYAFPKLDRFIFQMSNFTLDESRINNRCIHIRDKARCGFPGPKEHSGLVRNKVFEAIENEGGSREKIMNSIYSAITQIILFWEAKLPSKRINNPKYWQYLATDWFIDSNFNPILNEINGSPRLNGYYLKFYNTFPEMLNIVGYHFPPTLSPEAVKILKRDLKLKLGNNYNPNLPVIYHDYFNNSKISELDEFKQNVMNSIALGNPKDFTNRILENLTKYEVQLLAVTEDELSRLKYGKRIIPSSNMAQYFPIMNSKDVYYYRLLEAWEKRYQFQRNEGRELLQSLMVKYESFNKVHRP